MKRILFICAAFLLTTTMVFAQGAKGQKDKGERNPEERIKKRVERMTEDLDLSEDQATAVYDQLLTNFTAREAELETTGKRDERREIMKKYRDQNQAGLKSILTEEQFAKHEDIIAEQKEKRKARRKGMRQQQGDPEGGF